MEIDYKKYRRRFNYHVDHYGIHSRTTKTWWKPFYWLGKKLKRLLYLLGVKSYSKLNWLIREHLTYD